MPFTLTPNELIKADVALLVGWTEAGVANEMQLIYQRSETGTGGNGDLHLWTTDTNEYSTLASDGWSQEGIVGYVL